MIGLAAALAVALAAFGLRVAIARWRAPGLPEPLADPPPTAILLPLRDEQENAQACLETLLAQGRATRVIAVDDHSRDSTPEILARLVAARSGLETRAAPPLPAGWNGKVHALAIAVEGASEPWILTSDADTRHAPDLLARAHAAALEHGLDLLSLAGRQRARGLLEGLLQPAVFTLLDALLGDWHPHARGEARAAIANGQYMLLRRAALDTLGGFAAIARAPLDDVELARRLRAGGHRTGFRRAGGALEVRMYAGGLAAFAGWRRNLALFLAPRSGLALGLLAWQLVPALLLLAALGSGAAAAALLVWSGGALGSALGRGRWGRPELALLYPLDALLAALVLGASMLDRRRGRLRPWRGRPVPSGDEGQPGSGAR